MDNMDIRQKETQGLNISVKIDKKNYDKFIKDIKNLGKKYEANSNHNFLKYSILANCQKLPHVPCKGWCSRVKDDNGRITEVFFGDYDNVLFDIVKSEAEYIQEEYNLPPLLIFTTEESKDCNGEIYGNYHLICLKKMTFREVVKIQDELHMDQAFKKIPLIYRFRTFVTRQGKKKNRSAPKFKCVIGDLSKEYPQEVSQAHLEGLEAIYEGLPKIKYTNLDGHDLSKLVLTEYSTASNVGK